MCNIRLVALLVFANFGLIVCPSAYVNIIDYHNNRGNTEERLSPSERMELIARDFPVLAREKLDLTLVSHSCDSVLVTTHDDDGCYTGPGCEIIAKREIRRSLWGGKTFYCSGKLIGNSDYVVEKVRTRDSGVKMLSGGFAISENSWDYLRFITYDNGTVGILGDDCFRDLSDDLVNAAKGDVANGYYTYSTYGHDRLHCTAAAAERNYNTFCAGQWLGGKPTDYPCEYLFSPLLSFRFKGNWVDNTWKVSLRSCALFVKPEGDGLVYQDNPPMYASGSATPLGDGLGVLHVAHMSSNAPNMSLVPCRLSFTRQTLSLKVVFAKHSYMYDFVRMLVDEIKILFVDIVEPVIGAIFRVIWQLLVGVIILPAFHAVMGSTILFSIFLATALVLALLGFAFIKIVVRKLTSTSIINVVIPSRKDDIQSTTSVEY